MKRHLALTFVLALAVLAAATPLACQTPDPDRYLDTAPARDGSVRLVIFNPEVFNIRALATLRKNGTIDVPNLTVVGVYHERQTGNFAESHK